MNLPPALKPLIASPPPPKFGGAFTGIRGPGDHNSTATAPDVKTWREVLAECGMPADVVLLDFESFFSPDFHMGRDAKALSTIEYVMSPEFEVLGCGFLRVPAGVNYPNYEADTTFKIGEEEVADYVKWLQSQYGPNLENCTVVGQNLQFDLCILSRRYGIHCRHFIDILGLARHWHSRSNNDLDALCKRHGLKEKGDTSAFSGLTLRTRFHKPTGKRGPKIPTRMPLATDDQLRALSEYGSNDVAREWELFCLLLPRLSNPRTELRLMQHTLDLFLRPTLEIDYAKADELIGLMRKEMDDAVAATGNTPEELSGDKSFSSLLDPALVEAGDTPIKYYRPGKKAMLLCIAQTDPERELLENHTSERIRLLMAGRLALEGWPKHVKRIERMVRMARADGGKFPVSLKYCGGHTGRWAGGEKTNVQNFGSKGHELANRVRNLLIAPPDMTLAIVDEAAVEARILAWIAGQWDLVDKFANNEEIYCGFATKVLGWEVRKPRKHGGIPAIEARMKWARNSVGKIGILGAGFGMGAAKAETYADGAIDFPTAERIIKTYRDENREIVKFWKDIEAAFAYTFRYRRPCSLPRGLNFRSDEYCDVILTLPNGRELKYHRVKVEPGGKFNQDTIKIYNEQEHKWEHTWGGSLTENVVQAMARDTLAEAMLRLEERGYHTTFSSHDELIMCVPDADAKAALTAGVEELSRTPVWAPRMPLGAEGGISKFYTKI